MEQTHSGGMVISGAYHEVLMLAALLAWAYTTIVCCFEHLAGQQAFLAHLAD